MARLSKKKVTEALKASKGIVTDAAAMCGVNRSYLHQYIRKHEMQSVVEEAREILIDRLENKAIDVAMRGNNSMLQFLLRTQGKHRGYVERQEHAGVKDAPLYIVNWDDSDDPS